MFKFDTKFVIWHPVEMTLDFNFNISSWFPENVHIKPFQHTVPPSPLSQILRPSANSAVITSTIHTPGLESNVYPQLNLYFT